MFTYQIPGRQKELPAGMNEEREHGIMTTHKRFGDYAVEMGYCTSADVDRAVAIQKDLLERGHSHMLIGLVMVRYGIISNSQLIEILKVLERDKIDSIAVG